VGNRGSGGKRGINLTSFLILLLKIRYGCPISDEKKILISKEGTSTFMHLFAKGSHSFPAEKGGIHAGNNLKRGKIGTEGAEENGGP